MKLKITSLLLLSIISLYQINAQCSGADFEERNGIAIMEMESKASGSWRKETISGASANSALTYRGSNSFSTPGRSIITYNVRINSAGTYRFSWRNKISIIASHNASTEHNDTWLKIGAADFYGQRGSHRVYPGGSGKSPVANGNTSGGWFKIYTNTINWSWSTFTSDHDPHNIYARFSSPGVYSIQISGRSQGHTIDRMVLHKESNYTTAQAQSLSRGATSCSGGTNPPPAENIAPTVNITNPSNGQTFTAGSNVTIGLSASDSDGSITKHEIFVNNTRVDSDGSTYSPYTINNIQPGNYTIRATVTDNGGKTASRSITISAGSVTPPPPTGNENPTVRFTTISNGQNFDAGSTVSVGLSASDSDGSITKHQIYVNGRLVDTDGSNYTPHQITNIPAGNHTIRATVTDNRGATASVSATISVGNVTPPTPPTGNASPTVSISSLVEGQRVNTGSNVSIGVSAQDSDGTVTKHQIFVNGRLVDTDGTSFTPHVIRSISAGNYAISVTVTDNEGATGNATVNIVAGSGTTPTPTPDAISFNLIKASTNGNISSLSNGTAISYSNAQGANIRANAPSGTRSVQLTLSGSQSKSAIENVAPYALFGDISGNYFSGNLKSGNYTLRARAYSGSNGTGTKIADTTISFSVSASNSAKAVSSEKLYAYPNPLKQDGKVSLKLPKAEKGTYLYNVTNSLGVQLDSGKFNTRSSQTDVHLQLSNVAKQVDGVYYMTIIGNGVKQVIPIIRE